MITYDKLREFLRKEKEQNTLQKLPENFIEEVLELISLSKNKENIIETLFSLLRYRMFKFFKFCLYDVEVKNLLEIEKAVFEEFKRIKDNFFSNLEYLLNNNEDSEEVKEYKEIEDNKGSKNELEEKNEIKVKIKCNLDNVIGPDLEEYSFKEGEVVSLDRKFAEILIKQGFAEKIEN